MGSNSDLDFLPSAVFAAVVFAALIIFVGCGVSATATDVRSSPGHVSVYSDGDCVGFGCAPGYYGGPGNIWVAGGAPSYPWSFADARMGAIEAYRAQNQWVRMPAPAGGAPATEARDPRVTPLIREVSRQNDVLRELCRNSDEDCASSERE